MCFLLKSSGEEPEEHTKSGKGDPVKKRFFIARIGQTNVTAGKVYTKNISESISIPDMGLTLPEEFLYHRVFHTVSHGMVCLNDLQKNLEKHFKVFFIKNEIQGNQLDDKIIVVVKDREEEVIKRFFGWYKVENYEKGLREEQEALKNMNRSTEEAVISIGTVFKVPVKYVEITGEIGLLKADDPSSYLSSNENGKNNPVTAVSVKVLKMKRPVATIKLELPIHALHAVINFDKVTVNKTWSRVMEDELYKEIRKAVVQGIKDLVTELLIKLPEIGSEDSFRVRRLLLEYAGYWLGRIDYQKKSEADIKLKNDLMAVPFFKTTVPGAYATIEDLMESRNKYGKLAFVSKEIEGGLENERIIPFLTPFEEGIVRSILGKDSQEDVVAVIRDNKIAEYVKRSKIMESATISLRDPLFKISVDEEGITGEIGISRTGSPRSTGSLVRILKEFRSITTRSLDFPIRLEACINYDRLLVTPNWGNIIEDVNYKKVTECLKRHSFLLVVKLNEKYKSMNENDKGEAELYFLSYLINSFNTYSDILKSKPDSFVMKLASLPLIPVLGGGKTSMAELIGYYNNNKKIPYVGKTQEDQTPVNGELVTVLNGDTLNLLKKLFYHFKDCTQDLQLQKIAWQNMMKPAVTSLTIDEGFIHKIAVNKPDMTGELALPLQYSSSDKIIFTKKKIKVVEKSLYPQSRVFGIIESEAFKTDRTFTDVVLFQSEKRTILEHIYKLYDDLADKSGSIEEDLHRETARCLLLSFFLEQKYQVETEFRVMEHSLEKKICSLPLLPISDGRYAGIEVALSSTERLGYIPYIHTSDKLSYPTDEIIFRFDDYDFDYLFCEKMAGSHRLNYQSEMVKSGVEVESLSESVEGVQGDVVESVQAQFSPAEDRTVSEPEKVLPDQVEMSLSKEQKLLYALKREFRLIRETGDYKLSDEILRGMDICRMSGRPPVIFSRGESRLLINIIHPFIGMITDRMEKTPESVYYLLSLVYSTINREMKEIEDRDELVFQMVMLDHLLKSVKTANQKPEIQPV
jgi:hypothetical protein